VKLVVAVSSWRRSHRSDAVTPDPELTSLAERFAALMVVRTIIAASVVVGAVVVPNEVRVSAILIAPITFFYLLIGTLTEWVRQTVGLRAVRAHRVMLLLDGVYIAVIVTAAGGPGSQLAFLFYVHLIAVTLLGSHRAGLRIALWDSILLISIYVFSLDSFISTPLAVSSPVRPPAGDLVISILAFWGIALGTALFSILNERELRRSREELRILAAMGADLEQSRTTDDVIEVLLARVGEAFAFGRGAVLLNSTNETRGYATGRASTRELSGRSNPDAVVRQAWTSRGPVLLKVLDPETNPVLAKLLPDAKNVAVLPLTVDGDELGALALERGGPLGIKLPATTIAMLGQFASHAALAVRNTRLLMEIERLATLDSLTGLANRRVFETALRREVLRAERSGEPLSLIVIDVDHFKRVNDTRGHQAGDEVLRRIAAALEGVAREIDLVARYGGEEFAAIVPGCSPEQAMEVALRMGAAIAVFPGLGGVTISAGTATLPANALTDDGLIAAADEALYVSKRTGRDRVTSSTHRPATEPAGLPV
jgi:two-component system, cell cycle response regulator